MSRHRRFRSDNANASTGRQSEGRALDKRDLIVWVSTETQREAGTLVGRAGQVGGSACRDLSRGGALEAKTDGIYPTEGCIKRRKL